MTKPDSYNGNIVVHVAPDRVYTALTCEIEKWWCPVNKPVSEVGAIVKTTFAPNPTHWTFRANRLIPCERVELECIDANHVHDGAPEAIREEWLGTKLIWRIAPHKNGSRVSFVHEGLISSLLCYDICKAGWDHFAMGSLRKYLNSGVGYPVHKAP